jgi:orotate phosphoribosyltransferase
MDNTRMLQILEETGALLKGHFLLSSGKHSNRYIQCAKVLRYPWHAEQIIKVLCKKVKNIDINTIIGPAIGGIITSYEMGRQLKIESIFTERVNGKTVLRRDFSITKGSNILISEDVITTGKSTLEVKNLVEEMGAKVLGVACIVDRRPEGINLGLTVYSAIKLKIEIYNEKECALCKQGIKLEKPGSRLISQP